MPSSDLFRGDVAVVTGAGRGLGRRIAELLAARGLTVVATDLDGDAARATAAAIGGGAIGLVQDVRDPASHRRVAAEAGSLGRVGVWVNNAGVLKTAPAWQHGDDEVKAMLDVNLGGVIWGSRAAVDTMDGGPGRIINIASLSSIVPAPGLAVYAATKHAVLGFCLSLAGDLRQAGSALTVSAVCPAPIDTDMVRGVAGDDSSAILFSSGLLTVDGVAAAAVALVDRPRLVVTLPASTAALAHAVRPFPRLGLRILDGFRRIGERRRPPA